MIKCISYIALLLVALKGHSQESVWTFVQDYPIEKEAVWTVDGIGNVIVTNRDQLKKYGTDGKIMFEQSQKSFGRINTVELFNTLKLVCFSEEQQTLCFVDNSLTVMDQCIELSDYNVLNATFFATSGQSNKIWVFDQVNSTIQLITLNGLNQNQETKNLSGILDADNIVQMVEIENKLFFVDKEKGVYIFDLYGTLIQRIDRIGVKWIQFSGDNALMLIDDQLEIYNIRNMAEQRIRIPLDQVSRFQLSGEFVFFESDGMIKKYEFLLKD